MRGGRVQPVASRLFSAQTFTERLLPSCLTTPTRWSLLYIVGSKQPFDVHPVGPELERLSAIRRSMAHRPAQPFIENLIKVLALRERRDLSAGVRRYRRGTVVRAGFGVLGGWFARRRS
jgi:hypothetical protein